MVARGKPQIYCEVMTPPRNDPSRPSSGATAATANFGIVALSLGVMAAVLGAGAVLVPSLAVLLTILVLVEAVGTFIFAKRAEADSSITASATRARTARGLAILGVVLAAVALALAVTK